MAEEIGDSEIFSELNWQKILNIRKCNQTPSIIHRSKRRQTMNDDKPSTGNRLDNDDLIKMQDNNENVDNNCGDKNRTESVLPKLYQSVFLMRLILTK